MYVDAQFNPKDSMVNVVERSNGKRVYRDFPGVFDFYVQDPKGKYRSIHGEALSKIECGSYGEMKKLTQINSHKKRYESDIKPINKILEQQYKHTNPADLHIAFFDIETDFDKEFGYSQPEEAANKILSISIHLQWLDQTVCLAMPPAGMTMDEAKVIADKVGNTILYHEEVDILDAFLTLIEDADILSGWFSEGYDIPYTVNRIIQLMGRHEARRMCLWNKFPKPKTFLRGGKESQTYELVGRIHFDYMALYKKYNYEERHSYGLDAIAEVEIGERKVPYEGTLDELYNKDFEKFLRYNIQDTEILNKLDQKLQFISLANSIAHGNGVLLPAAMGAVAVTEQAIIIEAHERNMKVPDREHGHGSEDLQAAGGWVQYPKKGLHRWIGSSDLSSLYPSVIRCLNMSPETIVGQLRTDETNAAITEHIAAAKKNNFSGWWNDRFNTLEMEDFLNNDNVIRRHLDFEDGSSVEVTGAQLRHLIFESDNNWCISANGTIFRNDVEGVIPGLLRRWYTERQIMQAFLRNYESLADVIEGTHLNITQKVADEINVKLMRKYEDGSTVYANPYDPDLTFSITQAKKKAEEKNTEELYQYLLAHQLYIDEELKLRHRNPNELKKIISFWDKRQLVKKINLNSLYGGLLNVHCRFYDLRLGQSTTLTGRSIAKHMAAKTNEYLDGTYDHTGRSIIYGDTDSVYFSAYPVLKDEIDKGNIEWTKESVVELYDIIARQVSDTFPKYMHDTFNTPKKRSEVIKASREIVAETGLFIKKKRYAALVYDKEGIRVDVEGSDGKLKAMGLDLRRSDTPKHVQEFLTRILMQTLRLEGEDAVIEAIREFKKEFAALRPWEKGSPTGVNNLTAYNDKLERAMEIRLKGRQADKFMVPGHVMASLNWNSLRASHNDLHSLKILDGHKVMVCKLKDHNDFQKSSVAYPVDEPHLPDWFISLPFDEDAMMQSIVDQKVDNLLSVLKWDLSRTSPEAELMEELFDFT